MSTYLCCWFLAKYQLLHQFAFLEFGFNCGYTQPEMGLQTFTAFNGGALQVEEPLEEEEEARADSAACLRCTDFGPLKIRSIELVDLYDCEKWTLCRHPQTICSFSTRIHQKVRFELLRCGNT